MYRRIAMMKIKQIALLGLFFSGTLHAIDLNEEQLKQVIGSTYEVVLKKPVNDPIEYERELPFHLLPYQYRNDDYYPVGSAFLTEDGRFISAAHVVGIGNASQNEDIAIRDGEGNVYPIDTVYKYSRKRDFVVFSAKGFQKTAGLKYNRNYALNQKIYAVGNALGEGIIIRDGLYTSNTMEEVNGEWKWIRFSAAASPGNSGGPLIDKDGNVIGVILRKSENENLNYALPINEILNHKEEAIYKTTAIYRLDITTDTYEFQYDIQLDLPLNIHELDKKLRKEIMTATKKAAGEFYKKYEDNMFPNGEASLPILYNRYVFFFPGIIAKGEENLWDIYKPESIESTDTGNDGWINYGRMSNFLYIKTHRPSNISAEDYYGDSKVFMDHILQGIVFKRQVSVEEIRVKSVGKAVEEKTHVDTYGRKWIVRSYLIGYEDAKMITYSLPTPDGYMVMLSYDDTDNADYMEIDMQMIVNNLYFTYYGTLEQWSYFLSRKDLLPEFAKDITLETDYSSKIKYEDKNFSFSVGQEDMKISKDSDFQLRCTYVKNGDTVTWEPISIAIGESKDTNDYVTVTQTLKPPGNMPKRFSERWDKVSGKLSPYNGKAYYDNDSKMTHLSLVMESADPLQNQDVIFVVSWHQQGNIANKKMKIRTRDLSQNLVTKDK